MAERERNGSPSFGRQRSVMGLGGIPPARSGSGSSSGSTNSLKKSQNYAARAAAARLAQVMQANRDSIDDEEDDDMPRYSPYIPSARDSSRDQSPHLRTQYDSSPATLGSSALRPTLNPRGSLRPTALARDASSSQPPAIQRPRPVLPPVRSSSPTPEPLADRVRRFPSELPTSGGPNSHDSSGGRRETAALRDEIDMLQEENETLLDKLRIVEEKLAERDLRSRELEKQVTALGEGISLDSRILNRKEQFLKQREAALKAAKEQSKDVKDDEIAALRVEAEVAREEAVAASEAAREVEIEVKALRTMTHRMILTQEEMEEVVLKRCWLARFWGLAAKYGIHPEIATTKSDFWSSLAPLPLEVVLSAGQRAKEEPSSSQNRSNGQTKPKTRDVNDITGEGNIESMLAVEKGLRELAALKVEDAVMLALSRHRQMGDPRTPKSVTDGGSKGVDVFELTPLEVEDVQFKQAWLVYFWRRAKTNGVEADYADECIQLWISRTMLKPTMRDQVDVERGLMELRKLGIEENLWNVSRREIANEAANQKVDVLEVLQAPTTLQRVTSAPQLQ